MTSNIMIIDDSPQDRKFIKLILEKRLEKICVFEVTDSFPLFTDITFQPFSLANLSIIMRLISSS